MICFLGCELFVCVNVASRLNVWSTLTLTSGDIATCAGWMTISRASWTSSANKTATTTAKSRDRNSLTASYSQVCQCVSLFSLHIDVPVRLARLCLIESCMLLCHLMCNAWFIYQTLSLEFVVKKWQEVFVKRVADSVLC